MKIKKYHIFNSLHRSGNWRIGTEPLILKKKTIIKPANEFIDFKKPQSFYYGRYSVHDYTKNEKGEIIKYNLRIFESRPDDVLQLTKGNQFLVNLNWWQKQRLKWMFGEHWMQNWQAWQLRFDVISKPLLLFFTIAGFLLNGYQFYTYRNREKNIIEIESQINQLKTSLIILEKQNKEVSEKDTLPTIQPTQKEDSALGYTNQKAF